MTKYSNNIQGIVWIALAMFIFSFQNIAIKWISGGYPILEIVIFRSMVAMPMTLVFYRLEGGRGLPSTKQKRLELTRGLCLFLSYNAYFMGLAALPLAEASSIRFSAPLIITTLSVIMLGEKVGPRRWIALIVGFAGVLFIVRPGAATFNLGSLFVLIGTSFYAMSVMLTRRLKTTESSATMAYYSALVYIVSALTVAPLVALIGEMPDAHPSIAFLFRAWSVPTLFDVTVMLSLGFIWATGMTMVARAYSLAMASVAAPFEYVTLPISVMWGYLIWSEVPTITTWIGAALTLGSGLYILIRESRLKAQATAQAVSTKSAIT